MRARMTLATLVLALGVAGCGGDGDDGGGSDASASTPEAAVEETLRTSFTTDDPGNCTERATPRLVKKTFGSVEKCRAAGEKSENARSIEIKRLRVSGPRASATVASTGGDIDGQDFDVRLRQVDGDWRLDAIGLPTSQRAELRKSLLQALRAENAKASEQRCILRRLTPAIRRTEAADLATAKELPPALQRRVDVAIAACVG